FLAGPPLVDPIEALEEAGDGFGGDADAGVGHFEQGFAVRPGEADGNAAFGTVVFDGVVEQVEDQALQAVGIAEHGRQRLVAGLDLDLHLFLAGDGGDQLYGAVDDGGEGDGLALQGRGDALQAGEGEQVVQQLLQAPALADDSLGEAAGDG